LTKEEALKGSTDYPLEYANFWQMLVIFDPEKYPVLSHADGIDAERSRGG
jgi:hypothetical protein